MRKQDIAILAAVAFCASSQALADEAKKIKDNSFLVEEAYNQEAGVVQHIQNISFFQKSKDWIYTFTQEWPVPDEMHQVSYTIPMTHLQSSDATGMGDAAINYRYQALLTDVVALSPRISIILPTGDYRQGLGTDSVGMQANIPLSLELSNKLVTHWNLGATYTPHSREAEGATANARAFNYGASLIYLAGENVNFMLEASGTATDIVQPDASTQNKKTFFINPGVRFAADFDSGLQIVPGISAPIGVGPSAGEYGVLLYLSFEHPY